MIYPRPQKIVSLRDEALFIGAGLCGVALYFLIENIALVYTTASNAGIIVSVAPFFTALLAHFSGWGTVNRPIFIGFGFCDVWHNPDYPEWKLYIAAQPFGRFTRIYRTCGMGCIFGYNA